MLTVMAESHLMGGHAPSIRCPVAASMAWMGVLQIKEVLRLTTIS